MTGRDLIIYILSNGLENEPVFKDDKFIGFKTACEFAEETNVGVETVRTWWKLNMIPGFVVEGKLYIPGNTESPLKAKSIPC